jgi:hypothetical protein
MKWRREPFFIFYEPKRLVFETEESIDGLWLEAFFNSLISCSCSKEMLDARSCKENDELFDPFDDTMTAYHGIPLLFKKL